MSGWSCTRERSACVVEAIQQTVHVGKRQRAIGVVDDRRRGRRHRQIVLPQTPSRFGVDCRDDDARAVGRPTDVDQRRAEQANGWSNVDRTKLLSILCTGKRLPVGNTAYLVSCVSPIQIAPCVNSTCRTSGST